MNPKLVKIQSELKAPKSQFNSFGKYKYRNCEDILEALKPLLNKEGLHILLSDEVVAVGMSNYVKATATISDGTEVIEVTAYAREAVDQKGMNDAQITGSASSYARKYALNGLFAIDDTKDADSQDNTSVKKKPEAKTESTPVTAVQKQQLKNTMSALGMNDEAMADTIKDALGKATVDTLEDFQAVIAYLEAL